MRSMQTRTLNLKNTNLSMKVQAIRTKLETQKKVKSSKTNNGIKTENVNANKIGQNVCMHPWGGWSYPLGGYGSCGNPAKPCDLCACIPGNPPKLKIDTDGCEKGKLCPKPCPSSKDDHRVGDTWDCWHDDKK